MSEENSRLATEAEADSEFVLNVGRENPDIPWVLSPRDVWYANPFYIGRPQPHPEFDQSISDEESVMLDEAERVESLYAIANHEEQQYNDFKRLQIAVWQTLSKVPRDAFPSGLYQRLFDAAEESEQWFVDDDPRSMGWVDDKGRP